MRRLRGDPAFFFGVLDGSVRFLAGSGECFVLKLVNGKTTISMNSLPVPIVSWVSSDVHQRVQPLCTHTNVGLRGKSGSDGKDMSYFGKGPKSSNLPCALSFAFVGVCEYRAGTRAITFFLTNFLRSWGATCPVTAGSGSCCFDRSFELRLKRGC